MLDDEADVNKSTIDEQPNMMFTADDAILFKELVADGLLDEAELLENEPRHFWKKMARTVWFCMLWEKLCK